MNPWWLLLIIPASLVVGGLVAVAWFLLSAWKGFNG